MSHITQESQQTPVVESLGIRSEQGHFVGIDTILRVNSWYLRDIVDSPLLDLSSDDDPNRINVMALPVSGLYMPFYKNNSDRYNTSPSTSTISIAAGRTAIVCSDLGLHSVESVFRMIQQDVSRSKGVVLGVISDKHHLGDFRNTKFIAGLPIFEV